MTLLSSCFYKVALGQWTLKGKKLSLCIIKKESCSIFCELSHLNSLTLMAFQMLLRFAIFQTKYTTFLVSTKLITTLLAVKNVKEFSGRPN